MINYYIQYIYLYRDKTISVKNHHRKDLSAAFVFSLINQNQPRIESLISKF